MLPQINSGNFELNFKIKEYLQFSEKLSEAYDDVASLVKEGKYDVLKRIMTKNRLAFGTAGIRGPMESGYGGMNDLVIVQTSQGVADYLASQHAEDKLKGVVIGFDNRYNSERFALLTAVSFILKGFKVFLFGSMVPTPFVSYSVKKLDCLLGIMITASHNPKEDNGYKVYGSNGAQILPEFANHVQESILNNLKPWPDSEDKLLPRISPKVYDPLSEVEEMYYSDLKRDCSMTELPSSSHESLKVTFSAMHGVSHVYMKKAFQKIGFNNFIPVQSQMFPDPSFPTVTFPNPEEKECLVDSIKTAELSGCKLILANDPDADRLAVAEKLPNGKWHIYSGNEIGALLGSWLWKTLSPELKENPDNCFMISSAVSSKILRSISRKEGFEFQETLTGFKWMANRTHEYLEEGKTFVFAFEEAIGFMCGTMVMDKDGIQTAMRMTEMAAHAYSDDKLLYDLLKETYVKYGYHVSCNSYFICHDPEKVVAMFNKLRNFNGVENEYPKFLEVGDEVIPVFGIRDLTTGYDSLQPDNKAVLPISSSTQMITFYFENGCEATLRTSGTEPKVKYYTEMIAHVPENEWENVSTLLNKMVTDIVDRWIQPTESGFQNRPT